MKLNIVLPIQEILHSANSCVTNFKTALKMMDLPEHCIIIHSNKAPAVEYSRRFNAPATDEVAVLIVGQGFNE